MGKVLDLDVLTTVRDWVKGLIPTALKNPYKLTINNTEYDGSSAVTMTIGGSGDMTKAVYDPDDDGYVDAVEDSLDPGNGIEFSLDANGKGQYRSTGATAWIPFLSGGGGVTYTRLWTNGSPTSNFAAQDVSLSENAADYDAIRIVWEYNKSVGATASNWESYTNTISIIYDISDGKISRYTSGNSKIYMGVVNYASSYAYMRRCWFVPNQWATPVAYPTLHFDQIYRANNANNDTSMLIPLLVDGVTYS